MHKVRISDYRVRYQFIITRSLGQSIRTKQELSFLTKYIAQHQPGEQSQIANLPKNPQSLDSPQ